MMKIRWLIAWLLLSPLLGFSATELVHPELLQIKLGMKDYLSSALVLRNLENLKIAVLDNGFNGFDPTKGLLPSSTEMPVLTSFPQSPTNHGLRMAQIIWGLTGKAISRSPKFYLLNTNGFSNFKASVDFAINNKVDFILYSQVWPFGGNLDGTGFINATVNRAINAGILWVNAAGNNHLSTHTNQINPEGTQNGFLIYQERDHFRFQNKWDENIVHITLSWTDFSDSENYNTKKDLDLFVFNSQGIQIASSELIQRGESPESGDPKLSSHAREMITLEGLNRGDYRIQVKVKSSNFTKNDTFRILLKSDKAITFIDKTENGDIMPPADNPNVITVGDASDERSSLGPTLDGRTKPDIVIKDGQVEFTDGSTAVGSSTAAALFASVLCLLKSYDPHFTMKEIFRILPLLESLPSSLPDIEDTNLIPGSLRDIPPNLTHLVPPSSSIMLHKRRGHAVVVFTTQDLLLLPGVSTAGIRRILPGESLAISPLELRWVLFPRSLEDRIQKPWVSFRNYRSLKVPPKIWKTPSPGSLTP